MLSGDEMRKFLHGASHLLCVSGVLAVGGLAKRLPGGNGGRMNKQKGPHPKVQPLLPEEPEML